MAVVQTKEPSALSIKYDCGKNDEGKTIVRTKSYGSVRHDALADDLYAVASVLAELQEHNLLGVQKKDITSLDA